MKFIAALPAIFIAVAPAFAQEKIPTSPTIPPTPSVTFSGPEMDAIYKDLTSPVLYQKGASGALVPFVDPSVQAAIKLMMTKVKEALDTQAKDKPKKSEESSPKAEEPSAPASHE